MPDAKKTQNTLGEVKLKDDPSLRFKITTIDNGHILEYHSKRWSEDGVTKTVQGANAGISIAYQCRLVNDPEHHRKFWFRYIKRLPNRTLQRTSGTEPVFSAESAPRRR